MPFPQPPEGNARKPRRLFGQLNYSWMPPLVLRSRI
jgi:hypothetical protein